MRYLYFLIFLALFSTGCEIYYHEMQISLQNEFSTASAKYKKKYNKIIIFPGGQEYRNLKKTGIIELQKLFVKSSCSTHQNI